MRTIAALLAVATLAACATPKFAPKGDDAYRVWKDSDLCAAGSPDAVKQDLWMEATKFCAARRETPVEISSSGEYGIPLWRCASAELVFRCVPRQQEK